MAAATLAPEVGVAPACRALGVARATFYRHRKPTTGHQQPTQRPARALDEAEREKVRETLTCPVPSPTDLPQRLWPPSSTRVSTSAPSARCTGSSRRITPCVSGAVSSRIPSTRSPSSWPRHRTQTWSWDITQLRGPEKWTYFYLYVLIDIFSRYVVGWMVADRENSALASQLIQESCLKQDVQPETLTLHSDRGAPMTSKCTAQMLADLGVTRSLGRPRVSDDNPFSEAHLKTVKYHPSFPGRFPYISAAINFCRSFFPWYNNEHPPRRDRDAHPG